MSNVEFAERFSLNIEQTINECPMSNFSERFSNERVQETLGKLRHWTFVNRLFDIRLNVFHFVGQFIKRRMPIDFVVRGFKKLGVY